MWRNRILSEHYRPTATLYRPTLDSHRRESNPQPTSRVNNSTDAIYSGPNCREITMLTPTQDNFRNATRQIKYAFIVNGESSCGHVKYIFGLLLVICNLYISYTSLVLPLSHHTFLYRQILYRYL